MSSLLSMRRKYIQVNRHHLHFIVIDNTRLINVGLLRITIVAFVLESRDNK